MCGMCRREGVCYVTLFPPQGDEVVLSDDEEEEEEEGDV